jgi:integrase
VFTYENGEELRPDGVTKVFDRAVREAGLPKIRFHDLRHLHASLLIAAGVPLAIVSKRLGHSTIAITVDLYGHLLRDANRDAATAAAAMLAPKPVDAHTLHTQD